jgi:hypothetical protein
MLKKIYCRDCKYLKERVRRRAGRFMNDVLPTWEREDLCVCTHPENICDTVGWHRPVVIYNERPSKINLKNDCKWFEKRRWWHGRFIEWEVEG